MGEKKSVNKSLLLFIVLIVIIFAIVYNWIVNLFYYYLIETLGVPYISSISGLTADTIDWLLITLPFYLKIIPIVIFLPIVSIIIFKKKRAKL